MGDGKAHARKRDQIRVACEDCHAAPGKTLTAVAASQLDPESRKILGLRAWRGTVAAYGRAGSAENLVNVVMEAPGRFKLIHKRTGERLPLKPTAPVCVEGKGHARLSCGSCHTAWAPRCATCHTKFDPNAQGYDWIDDADVRGAWKEQAGAFSAAPPTLGVRHIEQGSREPRQVIDTFVPGMILTIERPGSEPLFRRLYARVEPHTTRRNARSCESCHNDPIALGYGAGKLSYAVAGSRGRWRFTPAQPALPADGLPADAWIPFLGSRSGMVSTREDVRPFTVEEQRRILLVGACLTCHDGRSGLMRNSVTNFDALLARRSPRCVLPVWN
jgi:hypothetical protein